MLSPAGASKCASTASRQLRATTHHTSLLLTRAMSETQSTKVCVCVSCLPVSWMAEHAHHALPSASHVDTGDTTHPRHTLGNDPQASASQPALKNAGPDPKKFGVAEGQLTSVSCVVGCDCGCCAGAPGDTLSVNHAPVDAHEQRGAAGLGFGAI
jgi:hypothetical protein